MIKASVIVPVFNDPVGLLRCLAALQRQTLPYPQFEIIVVDNGSKDSIESISSRFPQVRWLREPKPGSYNARNRGIEEARGDVIAFTDSDCIPARDWLERCVIHLSTNSNVDAIGGRIDLTMSPERRTTELFEFVFSPFSQEEFVKYRGFAATANMATRRDVIGLIGRFDGSLMTSGDVEWGLRLRRSGKVMVYAPDAVVFHPARTRVSALLRRHRRLAAGRALQAASSDSEVSYRVSRGRLNRAALTRLVTSPGSLDMTRHEALRTLAMAGLVLGARGLERARGLFGLPPHR